MNYAGMNAGSLTFTASLVVVALGGPSVLDTFQVLQLSAYSSLALGVVGLAFVWGILGILSLGHAAFFGIGAYAYAILSIAQGESTFAVAAAILAPSVLAVCLGYFLFYGRVGDVYLSVITLCVSLILFSFMNSTADVSYTLLSVPLGGFNGISAVPPLNWPGFVGDFLTPEATFSLCFLLLAAVYLALQFLRGTRLGRIMASVRENERRCELLGYDPRWLKLVGFVISAAIAGLAGALFTANTGYVGPTVFDLGQSSQFILWAIAGGMGTLSGAIIASFMLQFLASFIGTSQLFNTSLVFGTVIIFFVYALPNGIVPSLQGLLRKLSRLARRQRRRPEVIGDSIKSTP
ncbi:branched-chain amino acid ABC transporter permease [Rhizobium oryzicola]|uniref:Branched-chain amino acid ABC transporter permease n=1 Tax=Rhizobium oryzicola TaxID=1232668 RepID=A0ABT8T5Q8_9HYPH|nr:branched-chain amino acid ABC transporter permease [Rhizobium oryzicola]MDO1585679.1 branched-chain amino acid ABC transporter permease [Rhizobium oryzicola]